MYRSVKVLVVTLSTILALSLVCLLWANTRIHELNNELAAQRTENTRLKADNAKNMGLLAAKDEQIKRLTATH